MAKKNQKRHPAIRQAQRTVTFSAPVLQEIRQHARLSMNAEICGVLIGSLDANGTNVTGSVRGDGAAQGGAHVTFTQEAWVKIHEEKDRKYSGQSIVGWYHSHPGFGVFLSDHDLFIHKNFFSDPGSLAWVFDPHSDEEGCFGWRDGDVKRLDRFAVTSKGNQSVAMKNEPEVFPNARRQGNTWFVDRSFWLAPKTIQALTYALIIIFLCLLLALGVTVYRGLLQQESRSTITRPNSQSTGQGTMKPPVIIPASDGSPTTRNKSGILDSNKRVTDINGDSDDR